MDQSISKDLSEPGQQSDEHDSGFASVDLDSGNEIPRSDLVNRRRSSLSLSLPRRLSSVCLSGENTDDDDIIAYRCSQIENRKSSSPIQETHPGWTSDDESDHGSGTAVVKFEVGGGHTDENLPPTSTHGESQHESRQPVQDHEHRDDVELAQLSYLSFQEHDPKRSDKGKTVVQPWQRDDESPTTSAVAVNQPSLVADGTRQQCAVSTDLPQTRKSDKCDGERSAIFLTPMSESSSHGRGQFYHKLASSIANEVTPYITELSRSMKPFVKDQKTGVTLIHPDEKKIKSLNQDPTIDWLFQHESLYPHLTSIQGVETLVACSDNELAEVAFELKKSIFPRAKVILLNLTIPEDHRDTEREWKAFEYAAQADVIFSVGPQVYDHFENKYRGIVNKEVAHYCHSPQITNGFIVLKVTPPGRKKQVLTMVNLEDEEDFENYALLAMAMGRAANSCHLPHHYEFKLPVWNVIGVEPKFVQKFRKYLEDKASSKYLRINIDSNKSLSYFKTSILQSCLYVAPEKVDSFNFAAYLAMQAGIPVLVPGYTGIVQFLLDVFPRSDHDEFVSVDTGITNDPWEEDTKNVHKAIVDKINDENIAACLERARKLQTDLRDCKDIKSSHQLFLEQI